MDTGSVFSNALGSLIGGLTLLLLVSIGKLLYTRLKQHKRKPKEVFDRSLLKTEEYKEILGKRKSFRMMGYMFLFAFIAILATYFVIFIHVKTIPSGLADIGIVICLLCGTPLALYLGYSPISSQEVRLERQQKRANTLKQALGARPYGYIIWSIIFPIILLFYTIVCLVFLVLFLISLYPHHFSLLWTIVGIALTVIGGSYSLYVIGRYICTAIKYLKYVPSRKRQQLRQEFLEDEFE